MMSMSAITRSGLTRAGARPQSARADSPKSINSPNGQFGLMPELHIKVDDETYWKFLELKGKTKAKTHSDLLKELVKYFSAFKYK